MKTLSLARQATFSKFSKVNRLMEMSPRVERLWRKEIERMYEKKEWWGDGLTIFRENDAEIVKKPLIIRKAIAFKKQLMEMPIRIETEEIIVGNMIMSSSGLGRFFPDYATREEKEAAIKKSLSIRSVWGHSVPDYPILLRLGLSGIREIAQSKKEELKRQGEQEDSKYDFLEAVIMCCDATVEFANRYAILAEKLANKEQDNERKMEIETICRLCRKVPENPPESFREALQSFWFVHCVFHNTLNWTPIGRFDQYMYPFYQKDIAEGRIEPEEAQELIDALWIRFSERVQIKKEHFEDHRDPTDYSFGRDPKAKATFPALDDTAYVNQWLQTCVLGGQTPEGSDATNDISYMCLNATEKLKLTQPTVLARLHNNSPQQFIKKCCEGIRAGGAMPVIMNDDARLEHLLSVGIPLAEARDYCVSGCWEMEVPGKTEFRWIPIHALKCVEWLIFRGHSPLSDSKEGIDTGELTSFVTFKSVMDAFKAQLEHVIQKSFKETIKWYGSNYMIAPVPFLSCLIEGCLESAKDLTQGGAKYIFYPMFLTGLPNTVDSLAAIKKIVFDDKELTLNQLGEALAENFNGYADLQQKLLHRMPKFGNDNDAVDGIAAEIAEFFAEQVKAHTRAYNQIKFPPAIGTTPLYAVFGKMVGATPDGRSAGTPLATNFSPVSGMAQNGITSALKSFTKVNFSKLGFDSELDLSVSSRFVKGENGLLALSSFIKSFMDLGGTILAANVVNAETLRRAQKEPENFKHLRVRLGGWQAFFVALDRDHQDTHIKRVEHGL